MDSKAVSIALKSIIISMLKSNHHPKEPGNLDIK